MKTVLAIGALLALIGGISATAATEGATPVGVASGEYRLAQYGPRSDRPRRGRSAACVASGFATLTRNCSVDTGGCQYMPENCSYGWCCP